MKPVRCVSTPAADLDAEDIAAYYAAEGGEDLVIRFPLALDSATEFLRRNPQAGSPRHFRNPRLKGLRSWPVPGFEDIRLYYLRVTTMRSVLFASRTASEMSRAPSSGNRDRSGFVKLVQ